jgi:hypothetical protein
MPKSTDLDVSAMVIETDFTLDITKARATGPIADNLRTSAAHPTHTPSIAVDESMVPALMNKIRNTAAALGLRSRVRVSHTDDSGVSWVKQADISEKGTRVLRVHFSATEPADKVPAQVVTDPVADELVTATADPVADRVARKRH